MLRCKVNAVRTIVARWRKEEYGIDSKGNDVGNGKKEWQLVMAMFYVFLFSPAWSWQREGQGFSPICFPTPTPSSTSNARSLKKTKNELILVFFFSHWIPQPAVSLRADHQYEWMEGGCDYEPGSADGAAPSTLLGHIAPRYRHHGIG